MSGPPECRLLVDPPAPGEWNMAVDEALLGAAGQDSCATLRFYQWSEPTLSLGYFQRFEDRAQHPASLEYAVVRRQSGGGAILHDRELTYSLTLPASHPLAQNSRQLYSAVHKAILGRLSKTNSPWTLSIHCPPSSQQPTQADEPFLCFQRRAPGDVVLTPHPDSTIPTSISTPNWKIVGSAQRRHRGAILQHGSVLLARSPAAPELPGFCDLAGLTITASTLASALSSEVGRILGSIVVPVDLPASIRDAAQQIAWNKYGTDSWTRRR
jgi:lipoyl(octanoyl) transferase